MTFLLRSDLRAANSATQYPSIPTYHAIENGRLTDRVQVPFTIDDSISTTEKLDGTNTRIAAFPDGSYLIGSRTEWLTASGDLVANAAMGIVDAVTRTAEELALATFGTGMVRVLYGETFGGKINAHKQYTSTGVIGFRAFDMLEMPASDFGDLLLKPLEEIAAWRDGGGQPFVSRDRLVSTLIRAEGEICRLVPIVHGQPAIPPVASSETLEWLRFVTGGETRAALDAGGLGKPEGVVVRTADRSRIAKIRFEDYERAGRRRS